MDLPAEVRLLIFKHLFAGVELRPVKWADVKHRNFVDNRDKFLLLPHVHNILLVSSQIRDEALPALYQSSIFHFEGVSHRSAILRVWPTRDMYGLFPKYSTSAGERSTRELVRHISYTDRDVDFIRNPRALFPNLKLLEWDIGYDHLNSSWNDTITGSVLKHMQRNGNLRHTIKDYLERDYHSTAIIHALFGLQKLGRERRGFEVAITWSLGYRYIRFDGTCDLDEWILKVHDAEVDNDKDDAAVKDGKVYDIPQDPLFCEMS